LTEGDADTLRLLAEQCRRLSRQASTRAAADCFLDMARSYDRQADEAAAVEVSPVPEQPRH